MSAQQSEPVQSNQPAAFGHEPARRQFLRTVGGLPVVLAAGGGLTGGQAVAASSSETVEQPKLPQIQLGP